MHIKTNMLVIIANAAAVLYGAWLFFMVAATGFGGHSVKKGDSIFLWVFLVVTLLSVAFSHIDRSSLRVLWALIPVALMLVSIGIKITQSVQQQASVAVNQTTNEQRVQAEFDAAKLRFANVSKDYICNDAPVDYEFITLNKDRGELVSIKIQKRVPNDTTGRSTIAITPIGKIDGTAVHLFDEYTAAHVSSCADANHKTLSETYTFSTTPGQTEEMYDLAPYQSIAKNVQ